MMLFPKTFRGDKVENIVIQAPAKINLHLEVLGKRSDGYHDLKMIMQTVNLYDYIYMTKTRKSIEIECECEGVPAGEQNIAYKAAKFMFEHYDIKSGVKIAIDKKIPVAAGLAGGSSDAAAVMKGINELFGLKLDIKQLAQDGKRIGADVPFCIMGGTALAEGIGEVLTPMELFSKVPVVLVKPDFNVSTAYVFKSYKHCDFSGKPEVNNLIEFMQKRDIKNVGTGLFNALETVTAEEYREIKEIKDLLDKNGAAGSLMSGSGPSVFGIFENDNKAQGAFEYLKKVYKNTFLLETC